MNIFVKIKNSIYNPKYYSEVIEKKFSYSFKYLLVFALLFALAFTVFVGVRVVPAISLLYEKAPQIANYFPQELTITIKDGKASTNVAEPYFVKVSQEYKDSEATNPDAVNVDYYVVINTTSKFDLDTFYSYKTMALLTSDSIAYIDKGKVSIYSLSDVKDFTLNRATILQIINKVKPYLYIIYPFIFVGIYIAGYMSVISHIAYLLFGALLIWLVAKIKGLKLGYKKSYILGMQLMTGAIIVTSILSAISPKLKFTFLFSILLVISALINLRKTAAKHVTSTPVA